jgi:hypothetical protein
LTFFFGQGSFFNQSLFENIQGWWVTRDFRIEFGLRKDRLIPVVTIIMVADQLNYIHALFVTPFDGGLECRRPPL